MKLPADDAAALRQLEDEAIDANRSAGKVNHTAAAVTLRGSLLSLEAGGIGWAAGVRDDAEVAGLVKRVKARLKSRRAALPTGQGAERVTVPAAYSRRAADGSMQLTLWWDLTLDDLAALIEDMERQAKTLSERGLAMRYGLDLARRHGVHTAAEGFAAEGISIEDAA